MQTLYKVSKLASCFAVYLSIYLSVCCLSDQCRMAWFGSRLSKVTVRGSFVCSELLLLLLLLQW